MTRKCTFTEWLYGFKKRDGKERILKAVINNNSAYENKIRKISHTDPTFTKKYLKELIKEGKIECIRYGARRRFYRAKSS